jgi:hypothetical protein
MKEIKVTLIRAGLFGLLDILSVFVALNSTGIIFFASFLSVIFTSELFLLQLFGIGFWFDDLKKLRSVFDGNNAYSGESQDKRPDYHRYREFDRE